MKILLVDDDILLSTALAQLLRANDYTIDLAHNGQTGLELAMSGEYDLILLDWLIPKLDGISLCRELRSLGYNKPILLLTARNRNADIVQGLDAGADDYLIKPYDSEALLAKIRSLLRRSGAMVSSKLIWGNLNLDPNSGKVTCNEQSIALTATEYKLLELFLQNPNRIFSRKIILDRLWGYDDAPIENAVTTHIKDLRKKLKAGGIQEDILETVYGMGYRLKPAPDEEAGGRGQEVRQRGLGGFPQERLRTRRAGGVRSGGEDEVAVNQGMIPPPSLSSKPSTKDLGSVNRVLERFRHSFTQQVVVLEQAKIAILAGNLTPDLHQQALYEAHKLAGSMGSFGYPEGSRLARALEHLLIDDHKPIDDEVTQFSQLVTALQQELTKSPATVTAQPPSLRQTHRVLVIDDDTILIERLLVEADSWGMRLKISPDLTTARSRLALATPDAVLLDLTFPGTKEDGFTLLRDLKAQYPDLPIVVFTGRDTLKDRLKASRLGARQFLQKGATTQEIFQAIARVLPQPKKAEAKVLIVDDDPVVLAGLSALLTPWGLEVTTLSQPQQFWEVLKTTSPNLVLLDLEMPVINGLELCQVVRQDAHWGDLPILVVTAHTDAASLQQAFAAGADDFITKPVLGPELVTRVLSRIDRTRLMKK